MNRITKLLALGLLLSFFNKFRFVDGIGIGEILILISTVLLIFKIIKTKKLLNSINNGIVISLFGLLMLSLITNIYNGFTNDISIYIRNMVAFSFSIILSFVIVALPNRKEFITSVLKQFTVYLSIYVIMLAVYILLFKDILYLDILYYAPTRLGGFSNNPNQLALLVVILPILSIIFFKRLKTYNIIMLLSSLIVALEIDSDALYVAWVLSLVFYLFVKVSIKIKNFKLKMLYYLFVAITLIIFSNFILDIISSTNAMMDEEGGQSSTRLILWKNGFEAFKASPIIGNGTTGQSGVSGPFENLEAHNSPIDFLSMFGLAGVLVLIPLIIMIYKNSIGNMGFIIIIIQFFTFALFHNVLRQPIFIVLLVFLALSERNIPEKKSKPRKREKELKNALVKTNYLDSNREHVKKWRNINEEN